jgi:hypothetical protein
MKVGNINVKISVISMAVFIIFTIILIISYLLTYQLSILYWGIPTVILLLLIPGGLNYMSQRSYQDVLPMYEQEAKQVRIKSINENMLGTPIRIQGVVERVYFRFLNRPQYLVADKSGEISVKMFTSPPEDVRQNDIVEVLGTVMRRYIVTGDPIVNCVSIRKIGKKTEEKKKS